MKKILTLLIVLAIPLMIAVGVALADGAYDPEAVKEYKEKLKEDKLKREVGDGDMPNDLEAYQELQKKEKKKQEEEKKKREAGDGDIANDLKLEAKKKLTGDGRLTAYDTMIRFPEERLKRVEEELNYPIRYNDYYPSQYSLELVLDDTYWWELLDTASNTGHFFFHQITNSLWQYLVVFNFGVINWVETAFSLDIVNSFADVVGDAVGQIAGFSQGEIGNSGLWGQFATFMIVLAGAWAAYMFMIKRATTQAASGLGATILILILALALFSNASGAMKYVNDISSGLSQEILGLGISLTPKPDFEIAEETLKERKGIKSEEPREMPKEVVSFKIADRLYDLLIYEPYLILQYAKSSKDISQTRAEKILKHKIMSESRRNNVVDEVNGKNSDKEQMYMMTTAGTFERFAVVILLWMTHLILGVCFLIMAGAILFFQLLFVLLTLFAPFALLLALVPTWSHVAVNWFKKWIGAILMKLVLSVFLSLILTISQVLYQTAPPAESGYVWTITLQLVLVIGVIWKRKDIFDILKTPIRKVDSFPGQAGGTIRSLPRQMGSGYRRARNFGGRIARKAGTATVARTGRAASAARTAGATTTRRERATTAKNDTRSQTGGNISSSTAGAPSR